MARFYHKPVIIEAWQFVMENDEPKPRWLHEAITEGLVYYQGGLTPYYTIARTGGKSTAYIGDWIIREGKKLSSCNSSMFKETYLPARESPE